MPIKSNNGSLARATSAVRAWANADIIPAKRHLDFKPQSILSNQISQPPGVPDGAKALYKNRVVNHDTLASLANTDPVTWGIIRLIRSMVSSTAWNIVPDIDEQLEELDRWYDQCVDCVNDWNYAIEFASALLDQDLVGRLGAEVKVTLKSSDNDRMKRYRLETLFRIFKRELEQEAMLNCAIVKKVFERPNIHWEKSQRALLELVLKDLLIDDAGVIVHNYDSFGRLAELYTLPGWEVTPIAYPDRTVPQPPHLAYIWESQSIVRGQFHNAELTYIMQNPQGNGYGMSPVEALLYVITATLLGDNMFIKNMREGSIPPGIMNLKDASPDERRQFEATLYQQMAKNDGNRFIVLGGVPSENGEMQFIPIPKGQDFQKLQVAEYLRMAPAIKCHVFGLEATDLGLVLESTSAPSTADLRGVIAQRRAITQPLTIIEEYYNAEIVKQDYPFKNVKFKFDPAKGMEVDPLSQEQAWSTGIANGSFTRNEARKARGQRPIPGGDVPTVVTGNAIVQTDTLQPGTEDPNGALNPDGTIKPVVQTDPKKRNNATEQQIMHGSPVTK